MAEPKLHAHGALVIPDVHLAAHAPGRRLDTDFGGTVLAKLEAAVEVANTHDLVPVFTGDLVHRPILASEKLKSRLCQLRFRSRHPWLYCVGNHDIRGSALAEGDTIKMLADARILDAAETPRAGAVIHDGTRNLGVLLVPYGASIPEDAPACFAHDVDQVLTITHHDLVFDDPYPGAEEPPAIAGCKLAINGHMHDRQGDRQVGETTWQCPGALVRLRLDEADHAPSVRAVATDLSVIEHEVPHTAAGEILDHTGYHVDAGEVTAPVAAASEFAEMLAADDADEADTHQTDEGAVVRDAMEQRFEADGTSAGAQTLIRALMDEVTT